MPYIADRIVHDADAHVYERPGFLAPWVDTDLREHLAKYTRPGDAQAEHLPS